MQPKSENFDARCMHDAALSRRNICRAALVLGVLIFLVFGDVMIAGNSKVLSKPGCDVYLAELGRCEFNFGQSKQGNFALWCPSLFCGYPSFGGMQTGLVYPLSFPFLFLTAAEGINWSLILHTFLGGMLMYLWLGRQSLHRHACLAGAIMFAFCAPFYLRAYAGHLNPNNTIAWIPLVLLAVEGIIAVPTLGWLLLGTGAVSMEFLGGYPQLLFYTAIAAALYTLARIHESPKPWKSLLLLALMNVFVLGLTCVQWASGMAMANECVRRGGVPYEFAASMSLPPQNWLTLIRPGIFGDMESAPYWGRWYIWEMCLFFGVTGLFFSAVGLFHARRHLMLSVGAIVLALGVSAMGAYSPHFRFFYDHVPGFNMFRCSARFGVLVVTFLIFLSAHGLDMLLRDNRLLKKGTGTSPHTENHGSTIGSLGASPLFQHPDKTLSAGMFFGAVGACCAVAAMFVAVEWGSATRFKEFMDASLRSGQTFLKNPQDLSGSAEAVAAAAKFTADELAIAVCFLAGLALVLGLNWRRPQWRSRLALIVIGMIGLESLLFAKSMHVSFPPELVREPLLKASIRSELADGQIAGRSIASLDDGHGNGRAAGQSTADLDLFLKRNLGDGRTFSPDGSNIAMYMEGVSDLWGYGSDGVIRRYAEFMAFTQGGNPDEVTGYQRFTTVHRRFDMLRCKYLLITQLDRATTVVPTLGLEPLPKFSLVNDWRVEPRRDAVFDAISGKTFNPRESVILERRPLGWTLPLHDSSNGPAGTIDVLRETTDWQEVEVKLTKPAILLQTDLYTPNWHVYALPGSSQTEYELIPANYILRGIPLEAGTHRLRIEYRPTGFIVGKWVSLASLAAFLGLVGLWGVRRRKAATETAAAA